MTKSILIEIHKMDIESLRKYTIDLLKRNAEYSREIKQLKEMITSPNCSFVYQKDSALRQVSEMQENQTDIIRKLNSDFKKKLEELTKKSTFNSAMESVVKVDEIQNLIKQLEEK